MFTIQGKYNTAFCYAEIIEQEAVDQITRMLNYDFTAGSRICIMPDVHAGKGCTIGTTMTIKDKVVPNIVGVDIGCGMYTVHLGTEMPDLSRVDEAAHYIPSGMNVWDVPQETFDLKQLRCYDALKNVPRLNNSLGTLGGGNHFIEIDHSENGNYYLVIHSGSRNLGVQVANYYQNKAIDLHSHKEEYMQKREELIRQYKAEGRSKEIQEALNTLQYSIPELTLPEDLCYVYGKTMDDYLHDIEICQQFAVRSRQRMAKIILEYTGITPGEAFHTIHNYIDIHEMVLRKGAISAHKGEKIIIPVNMKDGCIIAVGKGNPEWNESAPHGAGRLMSRSAAKARISMNDYISSMEGIYTTTVNTSTLDEAPMAYKPLEAILNTISDTAEVIEVMKPIYNFKAGE